MTGAVSGSAVEQIVADLRLQILDGRLALGETLPPERELAARIGVSRPTLRQALSLLEQMGLVAIRRGRGGGATVTSPEPSTVSSSVALLLRTRAVTALEFTEFRRGLEIQAAQLAARRRDDLALRRIETSLERYLASAGQAAENAAGREFHYAVALASGNPMLAETMYSLNEAFAECFGLEQASSGPRASADAERLHRPILDAIRDRDEAAARCAMGLHFDHLEEVLRSAGLAGHSLAGAGGLAAASASSEPVSGADASPAADGAAEGGGRG